MVSVKRCSLPFEYIDAAHKLINYLSGEPYVCKDSGTIVTSNNGNGYDIPYAFFYLRYDEDQEWYNGDWWLLIASTDLDQHQVGTRIILEAIKLLDIDLPEFDFNVQRPNENHFFYYFDRVDVRECSKRL